MGNAVASDFFTDVWGWSQGPTQYLVFEKVGDVARVVALGNTLALGIDYDPLALEAVGVAGFGSTVPPNHAPTRKLAALAGQDPLTYPLPAASPKIDTPAKRCNAMKATHCAQCTNMRCRMRCSTC